MQSVVVFIFLKHLFTRRIVKLLHVKNVSERIHSTKTLLELIFHIIENSV